MVNLPQRKRIRLRGYDYSQNGGYFITICTYNRTMVFGSITNGAMQLNENGFIAQANIDKLNCLYKGTTVDKYVIMPNHIHMIITICRERIECVPNMICEPQKECEPQEDKTKAHLSKIMQSYKSSISKEMHKAFNSDLDEPVTQRNAYNAGRRNAYNARKRNAYNARKRNAYNAFPTVWQSRFHDHIIRNEREYQKIWQYIDTNPLQWATDCFYPTETP